MWLFKFNKTSIVMLALVFLVGLGLAFTPALTFAADDPVAGEETPGETSTEGETGDEVDDEGPSFSNPAQAQHAENLSAASASEPDEDAVAAVSDAEEKAGALEAARETLAALENAPEPDEDEIATAKAAVDDAQTDYDAAQDLADSKMAEFAGVSADDIAGMRESGMGWGQIAHELGVHPGVLGLGHTKGEDKGFSTGKGKQSHGTGEVTGFTSRDMKSGGAKGHGVGHGKGSGDTDPGSGKGNSGKGSGSGGGKGNSGGSKGGGKK